MGSTASDVLIETIHDWVVDVIFGLPGDGIDGVMEALRKVQDKIRFVHVRHEEAAAFMACAYAKYTGKLGVCLATSGPGGIHLLNGLYDANLDKQPVLAITGMPFHDLIQTHQQQDVLLDRLFEDVSVYRARVMGPTHVENVAELACRTALSYRGVAHITIPVDFRTRQRIGLRFPVDVGLVGDSRRALQRLLPLLKRNNNRQFLEQAQHRAKDWWHLMEERGTRRDKPMKPQVVAWELGKRLADNAIISSDSGTIATWAARQIPIKAGQMFSLSGTLATMANGLPYTIGAQVAYPDRQCVGFVGDGGFSMLMAEFSTAVKYKLPIKIFVIKNDVLGMIRWEQMVMLGNPEYGVTLEPIDFAGFARACGGTGFTIKDPGECGHVIDQALRTPGPVLVEAVVDPFEPPMPPKITMDQVSKFGKALARGEPNREKIVLTVASDKVRELI